VFFIKNPRKYLHKKYTDKLQSMLNNTVVSFYDNFGRIFGGSEDKATIYNYIEKLVAFGHPTL